VDATLQLSPILRLLLGVCIFLLVLAVALAILKAILERRPEGKRVARVSMAERGASPRTSEWSLWQELNRPKSENEQLRDALQQSKEQNEKLRDWIGNLEPFMWRLHLKWGLEVIRRMGRDLSEEEPPDIVAMEKWVSLTSGLIRKHYDDATADYFLIHGGDSSFAGRLGRLQLVADKAVDFEDMPMPTKFDIDEALEPYPKEWRIEYGG
jgi:hypothetical protein